VKLGERGTVLVEKDQRLRAAAFPVPLVDGSGGGDAFAAGYISGLLRGLDAAGCLTLGSALGASCVQAIGTTTGTFTNRQCEGFLRANPLRIESL
jgi:sugar/nucleoside kinase (ribokinase family)